MCLDICVIMHYVLYVTCLFFDDLFSRTPSLSARFISRGSLSYLRFGPTYLIGFASSSVPSFPLPYTTAIMTIIHRLKISPPLINSSCAWASDGKQLQELYSCEYTGAVTTRTATLNGFAENPGIHTVGTLNRIS